MTFSVCIGKIYQLPVVASAAMLLAALAGGAQREASSSLRRGDVAGAESAFFSAAPQNSSSAQTQMGLGLTRLREGHADAAADALRNATKLDPSLGGARLFLGIAEYQMGDSAGAARDLRAELAMAPESVEAMTWLTIVLLGSEHGLEAVPVVDRAVELRPDDPQLLYFQAKAHEIAAKTALGRLYALDPDSALVHRATAESLDGSGDTFKAVQEYEAALKKEPHNPDLMEALAEEQQKAGQGRAAAATFTEVLKLNPGSAPALMSLGRLDVEQGKPSEGVDLLRRAEAVHAPASVTALYLGLGLSQLGKNEEAVKWLRASLQPDASLFVQQSAWYQLARVYARLGQKMEQQDALAHLTKVEALRNAESSKGAAGTTSAGSGEQAAAPARQP